MKKTLIAIAALAATGAFAQSSVTISGTMDVGYLSTSTQASATVDNRVSTFGQNNSSTSAVNISGVEDLGGGAKASFFVENNPQMNGSATANGTVVPAAGTINGDASSFFGGGQRFVGLSGGWGGLKLGAANSAILSNFAAVRQPFGTALGGGYSGAFSMTGIGAGTRVIRTPNSARYDSPQFAGGFSASYEHSFKNKADSTNTDVSSGVGILGLAYNAGPLNASFVTGSVGSLVANTKDSLWSLGANYAMGATTIYGGMDEAKSATAGVDSGKTASWNLAVKHVMGNIALMANTVNRKDKLSATAQNAGLLGLGLDYSLSKRSTVYARYENFDNNKANDAAGKRTAYSAGIRHTF